MNFALERFSERAVLPKNNPFKRLVGAGRFELPTPCSRSKCATRLRYAPPDPSAQWAQSASRYDPAGAEPPYSYGLLARQARWKDQL